MRRIVLKVGSAVLTENNGLAFERMKALVTLIAELQKENEVVLVSSGAVSAGFTKLELDRSVIANKQALASLGQPILMNKYIEEFAKYSILASQILVTCLNLNKEDDINRVKRTINILLENKVLPIVNENDATSTEELEIGDNDQLSAYITKDIDADILVLLSDIDAYYDKDPRKHTDASVLKVVTSIPKEELKKEVTPNNVFATGGIVTKLKAAQFLLDNKTDMFLSSGFDLKDVKSFLLDNDHRGGTLFKANNG